MTQPQQPAYAQQLPPLPPQPTQGQRPQAQQRPSLRPRSKSGFSFRSHKSQDSYGSAPKVEIQETPREKASRRLSTKADPTKAMSEAQPCKLRDEEVILVVMSHFTNVLQQLILPMTIRQVWRHCVRFNIEIHMAFRSVSLPRYTIH